MTKKTKETEKELTDPQTSKRNFSTPKPCAPNLQPRNPDEEDGSDFEEQDEKRKEVAESAIEDGDWEDALSDHSNDPRDQQRFERVHPNLGLGSRRSNLTILFNNSRRQATLPDVCQPVLSSRCTRKIR